MSNTTNITRHNFINKLKGDVTYREVYSESNTVILDDDTGEFYSYSEYNIKTGIFIGRQFYKINDFSVDRYDFDRAVISMQKHYNEDKSKRYTYSSKDSKVRYRTYYATQGGDVE